MPRSRRSIAAGSNLAIARKARKFEKWTEACLLCEEALGSQEVVCSNDAEKHKFCSKCFLKQAKASTDEIPLAYGGIGVKCMAITCDGAITFARYGQFLKLLDSKIYDALDKRITLASVSIADLPDLERCIKCDYVAQIDSPTERTPLFKCQKCSTEHCRICKADWTIHEGRTCEQMTREDGSTKCHELNEKMSGAIIRECNQCKINFVKTGGCNLMKCPVCDSTQCYLCKAPQVSINNHFCIHAIKDGKCTENCISRCLLFDAAYQRIGDGPSTPTSMTNKDSPGHANKSGFVITRSGRVSRQVLPLPTPTVRVLKGRNDNQISVTPTKRYSAQNRPSTLFEKQDDDLVKENNDSSATANESIHVQLERPAMAAEAISKHSVINKFSLSASFTELPKSQLKSKVSEDEDEDEEYVTVQDPSSEDGIFELPINSTENKLTLATLEHTIPGAYGLKYKNPKSGVVRCVGLDASGQNFIPPPGGWTGKVFSVIFRASHQDKQSTDERTARKYESKYATDNGTNSGRVFGGGRYAGPRPQPFGRESFIFEGPPLSKYGRFDDTYGLGRRNSYGFPGPSSSLFVANNYPLVGLSPMSATINWMQPSVYFSNGRHAGR